MPTPTRSGLGEVALTTTLLTIYLGTKGTSRTLGAVQALVSGIDDRMSSPSDA
jgi:hypothetical protein